MKRWKVLSMIALAAAIVTFLGSAEEGDAGEGMSEQEMIDGAKALSAKWEEAFIARDLEGVMACYAADAVMFPPDILKAEGTEAIREAYAAGMEMDLNMHFSIDERHYKTAGDHVMSWGIWSGSVTMPGGMEMSMEGRFFALATMVDGEWKIVFDHASIPMSMEEDPMMDDMMDDMGENMEENGEDMGGG